MVQIEGQEVNEGNSHGVWLYLYHLEVDHTQREFDHEPTVKAIRSARGAHPGVPPFLLEAADRRCRTRNTGLPPPSSTPG